MKIAERQPPQTEGSIALAEARIAIRGGRLEEAERLLNELNRQAPPSAAVATLFGVICECRGHSRGARRWYGRAIRSDRYYEPAQQNMRRLFELDAFGRCREPISLGDEPAELLALLSNRAKVT